MKIKPGIYPDVPYNEYASWEAINHSKLIGFKDTPAHARERFVSEPAPTAALEFGWLTHLAVLEPKRLWREACVRPEGDARTKEVKPKWEAFKKTLEPGGENEGKKVVTVEERSELEAIQAAVLQHETAREYVMGQGQVELSICWQDPETKLLCKGRLDRLAVASKLPGVPPERVPAGKSFMVIVDLKTLGEPATQRNVEKSIFNYNYASAAAMYVEGLSVLFPTDEMRPFVWIVVESEPPHLVRLFTPSSDLLQWGYERWHKWLRAYAECLRTGKWPGWEPGIEEANLPPWAQKVWELTL
jgi:hypothetical protein